MVTYVDAATVPLRNNGQIKLYGAADFAGMRRASQLTAQCLDALVDIVAPGVSTAGASTRGLWRGVVCGSRPR